MQPRSEHDLIEVTIYSYLNILSIDHAFLRVYVLPCILYLGHVRIIAISFPLAIPHHVSCLHV